MNLQPSCFGQMHDEQTWERGQSPGPMGKWKTHIHTNINQWENGTHTQTHTTIELNPYL